MTGDPKFNELLGIYLAGKATPEQYHELMRMIKSSDFDDLLKQRIHESMNNNHLSDAIDEARKRDILVNILNAEKRTAKLIPAMRPGHKFRRWYVAAAAIGVISLAIWALLPGKKENTTTLADNPVRSIQPSNDKKEKKYIRLPDGSTVLLNEGSSIESPDAFDGSTREVVLKGEAYFDIRHDPDKPFIVHTGHVSTTVLGTAFNIKAYPEQKEVTVTVTRGKVRVSNNEKIVGIIMPNESIAVNLTDQSFKQEKVNAEDKLQWKKQYLVLDDISMQDAATLIDNRYHVKTSFSNEQIRDCHITATFLNNESLEQVMEVVARVVNAKCTIQPNDQVIISGEGCK